MTVLVPRPSVGRVFETTRRVRVADADPSGRLRLDAVARFVQDVGNDDVADAGAVELRTGGDRLWLVEDGTVRVSVELRVPVS